jgi:hypothetical protein
MPNPKRKFAAIQNKRDDQVLLIVEMACQPMQQNGRLLHAAFAGRTQHVRRAPECAQESVRRLDRILDVGSQLIVVSLKQVKAVRKPRVRFAEDGEIVVVLDMMMCMKLL